MRIQLPKDLSAVIIDQDDLSEGSCRIIEAAYVEAIKTADKLKRLGADFDQNISADDPEIESKLEDLYRDVSEVDTDRVRGYESVLIVQMVKSWDVLDDLPNSENVLTIPRPVFTALAAACSAEFNKKEPEPTDGEPAPKVETGS